MKFPRFYLFGLVLALSGCATQVANDQYMDDDGYTFRVAKEGPWHNPDIVRVVRQAQFRNMLLIKREAGSEANSHPVEMEPEKLALLLREIKFRNKDERPELLFDKDHPEELTQFSNWLSEALAASGPETDIAFNFPQSRGFALFAENRMAVGRAFFKDGKLNLIFSRIQGPYEGKWRQSNLLERFPMASRASSQLTDIALVATRKAPLKADRTDWVVLDPVVLSAPAPTVSGGPGSLPPAPKLSAEERLLKLQELKSKGLISDEEFQLKRRQILESI